LVVVWMTVVVPSLIAPAWVNSTIGGGLPLVLWIDLTAIGVLPAMITLLSCPLYLAVTLRSDRLRVGRHVVPLDWLDRRSVAAALVAMPPR
jgi:hypothetical protein